MALEVVERPAGTGRRDLLRSDFQRRAEVLHGQRIGRGNDGQHVAGTPRQGRDEVALERALQGEIGKEKRMPEDGMLDAVADPLARESEDRGAVGEAGPGKLRFVDAEKVRQLGTDGSQRVRRDAGKPDLPERPRQRPGQPRSSYERLQPSELPGSRASVHHPRAERLDGKLGPHADRLAGGADEAVPAEGGGTPCAPCDLRRGDLAEGHDEDLLALATAGEPPGGALLTRLRRGRDEESLLTGFSGHAPYR